MNFSTVEFVQEWNASRSVGRTSSEKLKGKKPGGFLINQTSPRACRRLGDHRGISDGETYASLADHVRRLRARGWAWPREVEHLTGRFTSRFLLHRLALSTFHAVYAFAQKCGSRRSRR